MISIVAVACMILAWGTLLVLTPGMWLATCSLAAISLLAAAVGLARQAKSTVAWVVAVLIVCLDVAAIVVALR